MVTSKHIPVGCENLPTQIAGQVDDRPLLENSPLTANEKRTANRTTLFGITASNEAIAHANLDFERLDRGRVGVCFGSTLAGFMETVRKQTAQQYIFQSRFIPLSIMIILCENRGSSYIY